ncbi:unnamed protein product [Brassica oleracea var. botrytis]|uniref:Post-GPI attachment to proteins factor 3 n=2 Tax=Brassica TaxID=3705 RepID=A0A3P6H382_BRAOL|nr:unnamed protein product [Brassica oleracea]
MFKIVSHHTAWNYMKSKKTNKKFDFKVFTETGPKTSLITDEFYLINFLYYRFKIDYSDLKNKGSKPTIRVSNVGHALHVWLNGEYHGNGHGSHDEKSPWSLSGPCFCYFLCIFHTRDIDITKRLNVELLICNSRCKSHGIRSSTIALGTTHVLYINFYKLDYASSLAMLLEIYDFPSYGGYFDAHSIWHLATVPLTILWWSFIRDDAEFRTSSLLKKSKTKAK